MVFSRVDAFEKCLIVVLKLSLKKKKNIVAIFFFVDFHLTESKKLKNLVKMQLHR